MDGETRTRGRSIALPSIVLGVGLGGLFDGIVFHQILQWHHMLTSTTSYPATTVHGLEVNTLWDGLFHATAYVFVAIGVLMVLSRVREAGAVRSRRGLLGWTLVGWGVFNLVEGIIDHHILGIHHVRAGPDQLAYDLGFLAIGAALVGFGWWVARTDEHRRRVTG